MIDTIKYIEKIALVIIIFATVIAIGYEIFAMYEKSLVELADLLLLFIYLELGAVIGIYFKTNHMPVRFLIYVAITALTRMLLEYLNEWHNSLSDQIHYEILVICGGIVFLALSILILRYSSYNYPSKASKED